VLSLSGRRCHCAKLEPVLVAQIEDRVKLGLFTAQGDNCDGIPMSYRKRQPSLDP
jgi:hypothetical protein